MVYPVVADPARPDRGFASCPSTTRARSPSGSRYRAANLVPKPAGLSFAEAACLPTAWLTAYRMLTTRGRLPEPTAVLVQGAGGGVATAAVVLAIALGQAGLRDQPRRRQARPDRRRSAPTALEPGARLPERVDVVIETVGAATFDHSMKCAAPGGRIVVSGATAGHLPTVDLRRVFALQLEILGTSMGTPDELADLLALCRQDRVRPIVDCVIPFSEVRAAFAKLDSGDVFGKIVLDHTA